MRNRRSGLVLLLAWVASLFAFGTPNAQQMPHEAEEALIRGAEAFKQEDWELAVKYFSEAYQSTAEHSRGPAVSWIRRHPQILLNLGLAHQRAGNLPHAMWILEAYLAAAPDAQSAIAVRHEIMRLEVVAQAKARKIYRDLTDLAFKERHGRWSGKTGLGTFRDHNYGPEEIGPCGLLLVVAWFQARGGELAKAGRTSESRRGLGCTVSEDDLRALDGQHDKFRDNIQKAKKAVSGHGDALLVWLDAGDVAARAGEVEWAGYVYTDSWIRFMARRPPEEAPRGLLDVALTLIKEVNVIQTVRAEVARRFGGQPTGR